MPDFRCCVGTFVAANAIGHQTITGIADADGPFLPKLFIPWGANLTLNGFGTTAAGMNIFFSQVSGTNSGQMKYTPDVGDPGGYRAFYREAFYAEGSSHLSQPAQSAGFISAAIGEVVIDWSVVAGPTLVNFLAVGGTDFDCKVGYVVNPSTAIPKTVSGLGIGLVRGVLTQSIFARGNVQTFIGGVAVDDTPSVGWTDGVNQGAACGGGFTGEVTRYQRTDRVGLQRSRIAVNVIRCELELGSLGTDQFTFNWLNTILGNFGTAGLYYAALAGALPYACGTTTQPGSPGSVDIAMGGRPGAVLFMSHNAPAGTSVLTPQIFSFGGVDLVGNQAACWETSRSGGGSSRGQATGSAVLMATKASSAAGIVITGQAAAQIIDTGCRLLWSTCDGQAREVLWFAWGVGSAPTPPTFPCTPDPPPPLGTPGCDTNLPTADGSASNVGCLNNL